MARFGVIIALYFFCIAMAFRPAYSEEPSFEKNADQDISAVENIASILLYMEHYVKKSDRSTLKAIATNETLSPNIRTLAQAIINIQHQPLYSDVPKLQQIMRDESAHYPVQELAYMISRFKYKPTQKDLDLLQEIVKD